MRACAVDMHMDMQRKPFAGELSGKMPHAETGTTVAREPAQSKCIWTCHRSHFMPEFLGKIRQAKKKQNSRGALCASLRCQNAHGHLARAILGENLQ